LLIKIDYRVNHQIRAKQVRVIDESGLQLGVMSADDARKIAIERGYDLIEVSATASPPVCRMMDYGKFRYQLKKKDKKTKKKQHIIRIKQVRLRPITDNHDVQIKVNHARKFLAGGDKVLFSMYFKGRERAHTDIGRNMFDNICKNLEDISKVEAPIKIEGPKLMMMLAPK